MNHLNDQEKRAAMMIARGYSRITTAHVLGLQEKTVERWLQKPEFRREVNTNQRSVIFHRATVGV